MSLAPGSLRIRAPALDLDELGELAPIGRAGGQGRVYQPALPPGGPRSQPLALKLYRHRPPAEAFAVLGSMIAWARELPESDRARLHAAMAWPLAILTRGGEPVGIAMRDLRPEFETAFVMPSGRRAPVLLSLEHLLGADDYLQLRGFGVWVSTRVRVRVAQRIAGALALAHRHGIAVCDIAPSNVLVAVAPAGPRVCLIDCDSMAFRGLSALPVVQTADWQIPSNWGQRAPTRAADVYKLGLVVLRLLARSDDARDPREHGEHIPAQLRGLLERALGADSANRPPAGEWERALHELSLWDQLESRYPGPAPASARLSASALRSAAGSAAGTRSAVTAAAAGAAPAAPLAGGHRAAPVAASSPATQRRGSASRSAGGALTLAWLVVMAVLMLLLVWRMLAAENAGPAGGSAGLGPGGAQYYYYVPHYYVPPGQGPGTTAPQLP